MKDRDLEAQIRHWRSHTASTGSLGPLPRAKYTVQGRWERRESSSFAPEPPWWEFKLVSKGQQVLLRETLPEVLGGKRMLPDGLQLGVLG